MFVVASQVTVGRLLCGLRLQNLSGLQLESSCPSAFFQGARPLVVFVWSGRMDVICVVFALAVVHGSECYCPGIWESCSWNQRVNHQHHLDEPLASQRVARCVVDRQRLCTSVPNEPGCSALRRFISFGKLSFVALAHSSFAFHLQTSF